MIPLIDGDYLVYKAFYKYKYGGHTSDLFSQLDEMIRYILTKTESNRFIGFLENPNEENVSFRKKMYPEYKAKRKKLNKEEKEIIAHAKRHLIDYWNFNEAKFYETDDWLVSLQSQLEEPTIICMNDKDYKQCPGWKFDLYHDKMYEVSVDEGRQYFWHQMLKGDTVDNVRGIPGVGEVKATQLLASSTDYHTTVFNSYVESSSIENFIKHYNLLKLVDTLDISKVITSLVDSDLVPLTILENGENESNENVPGELTKRISQGN